METVNWLLVVLGVGVFGLAYKCLDFYSKLRATRTAANTADDNAKVESKAKEQAVDHDYYQRIFDDIRAENTKMNTRIDVMRDEHVKSLMASKDETNACEKRFVKMESDLSGEIRSLNVRLADLTDRLGRHEGAAGNGH